MGVTDKFINYGGTTASQGYDASVTTIVVSDGTKLPAHPFTAIWWNSSDYSSPKAAYEGNDLEIIRCTNKSSNTLTIVRAQDGTSAITHNTGGKTYRVDCVITKKFIDDCLRKDDEGIYDCAGGLKVKGPRPYVDVTQHGADRTGATDCSAAVTTAEATLPSTGGILFLPEGTYLFNSQVAIGANTVVMGAGGHAKVTVLKNGGTIGTGIFKATGGRVHFKGLYIETSSAFGATEALRVTSNTSGEDTDIIFEDIFVDAQNVTSPGIALENAGADIRRVIFDKVTVINSGSGTATNNNGINLNVGTKIGRELFMSNVTVKGFKDGINNNSSSYWVDCQFVNVRCYNANRFGFRGYRMGDSTYENMICRGNGCGAWIASDSNSLRCEVVNCQFTGNYVGLMTEGLERSVFSSCIIDLNTYNFWCGSGRETVVSSCVITGSTNWGISTDKTITITDTNSNVYDLSVENILTDLVIVGCVISLNQKHGVEIRGVQRTSSLKSNTITRNGLSGANASTSTFADIYLDDDNAGGGDGTNNQMVVIQGNTLGNPGNTGDGTGGTGTAGESQYGIQCVASSTTRVDIIGNSFTRLTHPLNLGSGADYAIIANRFYDCDNNMTVPAAVEWDESNKVLFGTLEGSEWDGKGEREGRDGWYQDNVPASQAVTEMIWEATTGAGVDGVIVRRKGSITGVWLQANAAVTAGTMTAEVYVGNTATGLTAVLDTTNTTFKWTQQKVGLDTFNAGDRINVRLASNGSLAPTTLDVRAGVELVL